MRRRTQQMILFCSACCWAVWLKHFMSECQRRMERKIFLDKSHFHQIAEQGGKFRKNVVRFGKNWKCSEEVFTNNLHASYASLISFSCLFSRSRFISIDSRWRSAFEDAAESAVQLCMETTFVEGEICWWRRKRILYCYCFMWIEKSQNALNGEQCWQYIKKFLTRRMKNEGGSLEGKLWNSNFSLRRIGEEDSRRHVKSR